MKSVPRLIIAASESDADLLHATGFFAPDPFLFLENEGRRTILLNDLEIDRGRRDARVDEVVSFSDVAKPLPKRLRSSPAAVSVVFLKSRKIKTALVPRSFPIGLAHDLAAAGIRLKPATDVFWPDREIKSPEAVDRIREAIRITEKGMARAFEVLRASTISGRSLIWAGKKLTSERLRAEIDCAVLLAGGQPANTIVASGDQACDPHARGTGPIRPNDLVIIDIFPRAAASGFFGDLTRTVVRGRASDEQRRLWKTVRDAQKLAIRAMKPGASGAQIDADLRNFFKKSGYPTEIRDGRQTGFFHGTGHGLGLEIHEPPRFSKTTFRVGQVLTVEPGLYFPGLGGVRIEDVAAVIPGGVEILSKIASPIEL
jgi:Xaa-Pro aminopeptidase